MKNLTRIDRQTAIQHALWAAQNKTVIQAAIDDGKSIESLAKERGIIAHSLRGILNSVGINHGNAYKRSRRKQSEPKVVQATSNGNGAHPNLYAGKLNALMAVVTRLATELGVDCSELAPFQK